MYFSNNRLNQLINPLISLSVSLSIYLSIHPALDCVLVQKCCEMNTDFKSRESENELNLQYFNNIKKETQTLVILPL